MNEIPKEVIIALLRDEYHRNNGHAERYARLAIVEDSIESLAAPNTWAKARWYQAAAWDSDECRSLS